MTRPTTQPHSTAQQAVHADDPRWAAVMTRDAAADGTFYYAVLTTGVYCRPSCASRLARPENVRFYSSCADAERAGFRPCKRCKPNETSLSEQNAAKVVAACRLIETSDSLPSLNTLAAHVGLSAYHFHRIFKQATGLTPRAYAAAQRAQRMRQQLAQDSTVTQAVFNAGYNSTGRFYEQADAALGMKPSDYRAGGERTTIRFAVGVGALGQVLVAQSERGICAILLGDDAAALTRDLQNRFPRATLLAGDTEFVQLIAAVIAFVEAPAIGLQLPLDIRGTAFQQRVWQALRDIPVGQTANYTEIAQRIGAPKSVRAVAQACAANALAVVIPCHRVVRSDGGLSGYRWGVERKRALLHIEQAATKKLDVENPMFEYTCLNPHV